MQYVDSVCNALMLAHASAYDVGAKTRLEHAMTALLRVVAIMYGATIDEMGGDSDD